MSYAEGREEPGRQVLARLRAAEPVLSLGLRNARTPEIVRMASAQGYRVVWIDLEHSPMPLDAAASMASTAHDLGMAAWVRVPEREYGAIGRLLDGGATGIIAPKVETVEEAALVAAACRFPPAGARSQIAILPQYGFARMPAAELNRRADGGVVLQILIESARGVAAADAIAALEGVDLLGVGLNDLSSELGLTGQPRHPRVTEACRTVAAAAVRRGKLAVVGGAADAEHFAELLALGFAPLVFAGIDTDVLATGLAQRAADWRARMPLPAAST